MAIHTTRWSPDTCTCELEYTWDDTQPESSRTHNVANVIKSCPAHNTGTINDKWNTIIEENPRKNNAFQLALDNGPTALFDTNADGARVLKGNITFNFSWSGIAPNRVLTITFTGITLTTTQRNAIQNVLNTRFGAGKVTLG